MVKLCCGIFLPSLTYVTPLYTTCHLFHENHPIHPLDHDHDHLAVETLVCGVTPPQTLDQSCSCRDLPENDFLVLPFLFCCFYSEGFRIYHLSSQLTCWNASAAVSVALSEQIRSRESPEWELDRWKKWPTQLLQQMKKNLFQFKLSANIKWLCCSTAGRAKKEMAKTEKQEATILPGEKEEKNII